MASAGKPTLVYFNVQARAQSARYALHAAGVDFEDKRITGDEWKDAKANNTYKSPFLPVLILEDGTHLNQSVAVLNYICHQHGFAPKDAMAEYEKSYFFAVLDDYLKADGSMKALFNADADDEVNAKTIECITNLLIKPLEERCSDGRKFISGESPTSADFRFLTLVTAVIANPNGKNEKVRDATTAAFGEATNLTRIVANLKEVGNLKDAVDNVVGHI